VYAGVRRADDGDRLRSELGPGVCPVRFDVTDREQLAWTIGEITERVGDAGLQGLVNNAGVGAGGPVEHLDDAEWRWVFEVNLFGTVATSRAAIPLLRLGRGRIVHIGSMGGRVALPGLAPYSASKHAIEALAETMRAEFALSGTPIQVALVEPGEVKSAIWAKADALADDVEARLAAIGDPRYGWLVDQARGFIDEGRRRGAAAGKVASAVEHALTADRPKARYVVGADAKFACHVLARLPDRTRDALVQLASRRYEQRGRKLRSASASATPA
jgi:NAD(P)-dependent dehydrogenase (short-subunit alcohol dehydrogenase family)